MEKCVQCGVSADVQPVVAIMNVNDASKLKNAVPINVNGQWAALPICTKCHQEPKLKAHFHLRSNYKQGLVKAGSSNLGG